MKAGRILAAITALAAWGGLALQLGISVGSLGLGPGLWRFLGYFTVLTNIFVAKVVTAQALGIAPHGLFGLLARPVFRLSATASIGLVAIAYAALLRGLVPMEGWQIVADFFLHTAVPILAALCFIVDPPKRLPWWLIVPAAAWPVAYVVYALVRGAAHGWYAYFFLDPTKMTVPELAASLAGLTALFAAIAAVLIAAQRVRLRFAREI